MNGSTVSLGRHARHGIILAIVLASFGLAEAFFRPLAGLIATILYLAIAWGIRTRRPGAALAGAGYSLVSVVFAISVMFRPPAATGWLAPAIMGIVHLLCVCLFLRAWLDLRSDPAHTGSDWPWYSVPIAMVIFWICFQPFVIPSAAMQNTILLGDYIIVDRIHTELGRDARYGEIVAFRYPLNHREDYIKRVVGVPGDRLHLVHKQLYRNGSAVTESYAIHSSGYEDTYRDNFPAAPNAPLPEPAVKMLQESVANGELTVPRGKYFVLGDNRDDSADSRYWGFVDRGEIIGRPVLIYDSHPGDPRTVFNERWNRLLHWL